MSRSAEVMYRRQKVARREYRDLITDEIWFLRRQADRLVASYREYFEAAKSILDLGAGTCWFAAHMESHYNKAVFSADVSSEVMELSAELYGFEGTKFVGEAKDLVNLGRQFDLICCCAVLHHIDDLAEFYRQIAKLLRPGGLFLAFNEPRAPQFPPLRLLHRVWFGRSTRPYGVLDLPRTSSGYIGPLPPSMEGSTLVDYEKSQRNYSQALGAIPAAIYSTIAQASMLNSIRSYFIPEAILIVIWRKVADSGPSSRKIEEAKFSTTESGKQSETQRKFGFLVDGQIPDFGAPHQYAVLSSKSGLPNR